MAITKNVGGEQKRKAFTFMDFLQNPALLEEAGKGELAEAYFQISEFSKEVEGAKKAINETLWDKVENNGDLITGTDGKRYIATKISNPKFSTKIEQAEELGATKTKTVVDTEKLKTLVANGIEVPGYNVSKYVLVKEVLEKAV